MRTLVITGCAAAAALTACGGAHAAHVASKTPATVTLLQACRALRADILANGGEADKPTLHRLLVRLPVGGTAGALGRLAGDIGLAAAGVGTSLWPLYAGRLASDCRSTGVQIPGG